MNPQKFGPYTLLRPLGKGGMAEVFLAEAEGTGGFSRLLAIKRLLPPFCASEQLVSMLGDEARLSVWLSHPNIVQVLDFGEVAGTYYIAMEFVEGCDLCKLVRLKNRTPGRPLPLATGLYVGQMIADALAYAHKRSDSDGRPLGIIHRDVSPHNVLISREGQVKLADFGLARATISVHHSHAGVIRGKFAYMPKEQASGADIDHRIDIFAAGATLYETITGHRPYSAKNLAQQLYQLAQPVSPPSAFKPEIPPELDDLIMQAISPDPETRYQTAEDLASDLGHALASLSTPNKEAQRLATLVEELVGPPVAVEERPIASMLDLPAHDTSLIGAQLDRVRKAHDTATPSLPARLEEPEDFDTVESPSVEVSRDSIEASLPDDDDSVPTLARRLSGRSDQPRAEFAVVVPRQQAQLEVPSGSASDAPTPLTAAAESDDDDELDNAETIERSPEQARADVRRALAQQSKQARPRSPRAAAQRSPAQLPEDPSEPTTAPELHRPRRAAAASARAKDSTGPHAEEHPTARVGKHATSVTKLIVGALMLLALGAIVGWMISRRPGPNRPAAPPSRPPPAVGPVASPISGGGATDGDPDADVVPPQLAPQLDGGFLDDDAAPSARRVRRTPRRSPSSSTPRRSKTARGVSAPPPKTRTARSRHAGKLDVEANEKALVFVDERVVGPIPLSGLDLPPGIHRVKVLYESDSTYSAQRFVSIEAGKTSRMVFTR